ncbi:hypothetical protein MUGA111182_18855 [Mucilaginibacter galii]|uniref:Uncharacterized protein n=1 Tax=Mucilaginibacter galii TaxID=2005073 RepID=A0A917N4J3_9SPHI|nr:hypothetical protein [Mucilaginibacter galii]GGI52177.1 hypothetical protein GCM10011425_33890 [Mucilaginibacter galii]
METTTQKLQNLISDEKKSQENINQIKNFQQALENFESLVESGMAKHRGNQLLSIEDSYSHTKNYSFNANFK